MRIEENGSDQGFVLECSGKRFYSNMHIIGIREDLSVTEGADGVVHTDEFTREERHELADYMIKLWTEFKNKI